MSMQQMCSAPPLAQLVAVSALGQDAAASSAPAKKDKDAAGDNPTAFRPVEGGGNIQSGEWLLVEAYSAMWLLALGLVLFTILKQRKLDAQIAQLSSDLARARQQQDGGTKDG